FHRRPTGVTLDPAAPSHAAGSLPLGATLSPEGDRVVLLLCGWREQGVQVMDRATGEITQFLPQTAAFVGVVFSPDGHTLWASGGNDDSIYRYTWQEKRAALAERIVLHEKKEEKEKDKEKEKEKKEPGIVYPAGLALSH